LMKKTQEISQKDLKWHMKLELRLTHY
jgi:hypothetical protein